MQRNQALPIALHLVRPRFIHAPKRGPSAFGVEQVIFSARLKRGIKVADLLWRQVAREAVANLRGVPWVRFNLGHVYRVGHACLPWYWETLREYISHRKKKMRKKFTRRTVRPSNLCLKL